MFWEKCSHVLDCHESLRFLDKSNHYKIADESRKDARDIDGRYEWHGVKFFEVYKYF